MILFYIELPTQIIKKTWWCICLVNLFYFVFQKHKWSKNWFVFNDLILDFRFVPIQCHISDIFKHCAALLLQMHKLLCFLNTYHCIWIVSEKQMNGLFQEWRYTQPHSHSNTKCTFLLLLFRFVWSSFPSNVFSLCTVPIYFTTDPMEMA